jgi:hypothetical protein
MHEPSKKAFNIKLYFTPLPCSVSCQKLPSFHRSLFSPPPTSLGLSCFVHRALLHNWNMFAFYVPTIISVCSQNNFFYFFLTFFSRSFRKNFFRRLRLRSNKRGNGRAETFISISCDASGGRHRRKEPRRAKESINLLCAKVFSLRIMCTKQFLPFAPSVHHAKQPARSQEPERGWRHARNHWVGSDRFYQF